MQCRLTNPVGLQLSELSVDPRLAKAILASAGDLACSQEVVTVVAILSVHSVWAGARGERKAQNEAKMRYVSCKLYIPVHCTFLDFVYNLSVFVFA